MSTCIIYEYINCSPCVNCLEDRLELKRRTEVNISKSVTRKSTQLTVFIIDSTSASLETSPPKVMAWPPDASICKTEEYHYLLGYLDIVACRIKQRHEQKRKHLGPLKHHGVFCLNCMFLDRHLKTQLMPSHS